MEHVASDDWMTKQLSSAHIEHLNVSKQGWTHDNKISMGCATGTVTNKMLMAQQEGGIRGNTRMAKDATVQCSNK